MDHEMSSITVVIVNYNTRQCLRACLATVRLEAPAGVIVVDNASTDGSVDMLQSEFPWVAVQANEANRGYGAAANQAIADCSTKYALLLNADTLLQTGALAALTDYLDRNPRVAIVGPRLVERDGTLQGSCYPFPTPLHTFLENSKSAVFLGRRIRQRLPVIRSFYLRTWAHDRPRVVPWIKGAALAIRLDAFNAVGGFDESFFMYFEDADLCYRLKTAGWQVHFCPVTTVVHLGGASTLQQRVKMDVQLLISTVEFYKRHATKFQLARLLLVVKWLMLAKWFGANIRRYLTRDQTKRCQIEDAIAASRAVLLGHWRRQESLLAGRKL